VGDEKHHTIWFSSLEPLITILNFASNPLTKSPVQVEEWPSLPMLITYLEKKERPMHSLISAKQNTAFNSGDQDFDPSCILVGQPEEYH
jgi:hypothetical protein